MLSNIAREEYHKNLIQKMSAFSLPVLNNLKKGSPQGTITSTKTWGYRGKVMGVPMNYLSCIEVARYESTRKIHNQQAILML